MADAGFYRGTSSEQDSRFTDKERKLLKQMRFEGSLDEKICMDRVNLDVLKPWITAKLNEILGVEDDVLIEYVFSQLEEKSLNPKVMQINLTGFLNARRAREFMGELWGMLLEAQNSEDGIPKTLVERKIKEIQEKTKDVTISSSNGAAAVAAEAAGSDWKNRYNSLTGGRFAYHDSKNADRGRESDASRTSKKDDDRRRDHRDTDRSNRGDRDTGWSREDRRSRDKDDSGKRTDRKRERERDEKYSRDEKQRQESRSPTRRHLYDEKMEKQKARSRSPKKSPPRRRFTERKEESRRERSRSADRRQRKRASNSSDSEEEKAKKKKKHTKKQSESSSDHRHDKKRKKHKKEKKRKKARHNSESS